MFNIIILRMILCCEAQSFTQGARNHKAETITQVFTCDCDWTLTFLPCLSSCLFSLSVCLLSHVPTLRKVRLMPLPVFLVTLYHRPSLLSSSSLSLRSDLSWPPYLAWNMKHFSYLYLPSTGITTMCYNPSINLAHTFWSFLLSCRMCWRFQAAIVTALSTSDSEVQILLWQSKVHWKEKIILLMYFFIESLGILHHALQSHSLSSSSISAFRTCCLLPKEN